LECDLRIDLESVSRRHVKLHCGVTLELEDLGSSNGTRVSGRRLGRGETVALSAGAVVEIGGAVLFVRGVLRDMTEAAAPVPGGADDRPGMNDVTRLLELVARSNIDVILLGETGVGKEVAAEGIHRVGEYRNGLPR
jgi:hypothetical protein